MCSVIEPETSIRQNITALAIGFGFDVEAFSVEALDRARDEATEPFDREHVTPFIQRDPAVRAAVLEADGAVPEARAAPSRARMRALSCAPNAATARERHSTRSA